MTIEREEPGLMVATCDQCGDRAVLDLEPEAEDGEIGKAELADALEAIEWERRTPVRQYFPSDFGNGRHILTFEQDFCPDCQTDEKRPKPIFRHQPPRPPARDAFDNDPCDEWPRALVFEALGLRADCGHPREYPPASCPYCADGYPIGSVQSWAKRA